MPIEIRELVIKTSVSNEAQGTGAPSSDNRPGDSDAIIAACVDQVLAILKDQVER